jgi:hypothetical protein
MGRNARMAGARTRYQDTSWTYKDSNNHTKVQYDEGHRKGEVGKQIVEKAKRC